MATAATTEKLPCITYADIRAKSSETHDPVLVKLKEEFNDGTHITSTVTKATNETGFTTLLTDTIPEFLEKGLNKLHYDGTELYENFSEVLGGNFQQTWREVESGRPLNQRTEANFKLDLFQLLQTETGDPHFDQTLKDYLLHSASPKLIKPRETSPKDHASIMRSLIGAYNNIPTVVPLTAVEQKSCHFKSYPLAWREDYSKSHDEVSGIPFLTQNMQLRYDQEVQGRAHDGARARQARKRSTEQYQSRRHGNSVGVSNQRFNPGRGRGQPRTQGRGRPYGGQGYERNRRVRGPEDGAPCPIHCEGMSRNAPGVHTWRMCFDNRKGPNYRPDRGSNNSRNNANDAYYQGGQQQPTASATRSSTGTRVAASAGRGTTLRRFAPTSNAMWDANNNTDQHYLDMFGFPPS